MSKVTDISQPDFVEAQQRPTHAQRRGEFSQRPVRDAVHANRVGQRHQSAGSGPPQSRRWFADRNQHRAKNPQRIRWNPTDAAQVNVLCVLDVLRFQQVNGMLPVDCIIGVVDVVNVVFVVAIHFVG